MTDLRTKVQQVFDRKYEHKTRLLQELASLDDLYGKEIMEVQMAVQSECLRIHGAHVDDDGMFVFVCRHCGYCPGY